MSNSGVITILNPVPVLLALNPTSAPARGTGFPANVNGLNFVTPSKVRWNGAERTTAYISNIQLTSPVAPGRHCRRGNLQCDASRPQAPEAGLRTP